MSNNKKVLKLPRVGYGPLCNKMLSAFIEHNGLDKSLEMPKDKPIKNEEALSLIFDAILHSMGQEKRVKLIEEIEEACECLPPGIKY